MEPLRKPGATGSSPVIGATRAGEAAHRAIRPRDLVLFAGALRLTRLAQQLRTRPLEDLISTMITARPRVRTPEPRAAATAAIRAGARVERWFGGLDTCLTLSLVAGALLADRGDVVLHLGFRHGPEEARLDGHAWLDVAGELLQLRQPPDPAARPYTAIASFALTKRGVTAIEAPD